MRARFAAREASCAGTGSTSELAACGVRTDAKTCARPAEPIIVRQPAPARSARCRLSLARSAFKLESGSWQSAVASFTPLIFFIK